MRDGILVSATVILDPLPVGLSGGLRPRLAVGRMHLHDTMTPLRSSAFIAWAGMRGAVSLAAALALPLTTRAGAPLAGRPLIVFLTYCVILTTLVGQGLTTPLVLRLLGLEEDGTNAKEEAKSRIYAADAALRRLDELVGEGWVREDTAERMRGAYRFRRSRFAARFDDGDDGAIEERSQAYQRLRRELLEAERGAIVVAARRGAHQRRGHAQRRARPRPRGPAARRVDHGSPGNSQETGRQSRDDGIHWIPPRAYWWSTTSAASSSSSRPPCATRGSRSRRPRTGATALRSVASWRPDLVVLDVMLPDLDGHEVHRRLDGSTPVPILYLTARDATEDKVRGLTLGADDYVTKPFSLEELVARVRSVLRRTRPDSAHAPAGSSCTISCSTRTRTR